SGYTYNVYVKAYIDSTGGAASSTLSIAYLAAPGISSLSSTSSGIYVAWGTVSGASGYKVYRKTGSGSYSLVKTTTDRSWTDTGTSAGNTYTYQVYAYSGTTTSAASAEKSVTRPAASASTSTVTLAAGKITSLTNTSAGIKIKWTAVSGADGYYIYRKTSSGKYSRIKTIKSASTVSYTDKKIADNNGTTYIYKVVPYSGSTKGTGTASTTVRLTRTSLTSLKNSAAGKMRVKWTSVTGVTGYQIQYSTSKTFASGNKTKKVAGASSVKKTLSSLTKGKTYYVRIRTYKTVNGKTYYSAWSSKLKVKITK
ncbi:MAG: hypothetical protein LUD18_07210, partial [Lachnospiraceae bacterium]|nr:hypothetical protein [Lachnospiraceae bacterium]